VSTQNGQTNWLNVLIRPRISSWSTQNRGCHASCHGHPVREGGLQGGFRGHPVREGGLLGGFHGHPVREGGLLGGFRGHPVREGGLQGGFRGHPVREGGLLGASHVCHACEGTLISEGIRSPSLSRSAENGAQGVGCCHPSHSMKQLKEQSPGICNSGVMRQQCADLQLGRSKRQRTLLSRLCILE
jgi:hypothetical protein